MQAMRCQCSWHRRSFVFEARTKSSPNAAKTSASRWPGPDATSRSDLESLQLAQLANSWKALAFTILDPFEARPCLVNSTYESCVLGSGKRRLILTWVTRVTLQLHELQEFHVSCSEDTALSNHRCVQVLPCPRRPYMRQIGNLVRAVPGDPC